MIFSASLTKTSTHIMEGKKKNTNKQTEKTPNESKYLKEWKILRFSFFFWILLSKSENTLIGF